MAVWDRRPCAHGCRCRLCRLAHEQTTVDDIRELEDCKIAGFGRRTKALARLYSSTIAPGYVDPLEHDVLVYEVAEIGETITNAAKSQRLDAMGD